MSTKKSKSITERMANMGWTEIEPGTGMYVKNKKDDGSLRYNEKELQEMLNRYYHSQGLGHDQWQ